MNSIQPRQWLESLDDIYNPTMLSTQGAVLLLDGHGDDLFFHDVHQPAIALHKLLYERFRHSVDAFVWYQVLEGGQLQYEFNRFPTANVAVSPPAETSTSSDDLLGLGDLEQDRTEWQAEHEGRTTHARTPQEAIREIDTLLKTPGHQAVVVFQDVFWAVTEDSILARLRTWPELCQAHHHLVVFVLGHHDLNWVKFCFGQDQMKGVKRLSADGPTITEVKAFLIHYHLKHNYNLFDWQLLDEIASRLAENVGANPGEGFKALVMQRIPGIEEAGLKLDVEWLNIQPQVGQKAEEIHLDDLVLKPTERAFFENSLLPALRNPDWRRKEAERLGVDESKIQVSSRILLYGPPGTGKTTIGKMIATESRRRFYSVKAADFQSTYRGGPVEKVAQHFAEWRQNAPCVVFWDEVESIAANRAHSQHEDNPITQILAELEPTTGRDEGLIIICATNLPEKLDPAFRNRFRNFLIGYPDQNGRVNLVEQYFEIHLLEQELTIADLVKMLDNRSPREIKYCAESCINQLSVHQERAITRQMVRNWLVTNAIDKQTAQRWQEEEAKQQRQLRESGVI